MSTVRAHDTVSVIHPSAYIDPKACLGQGVKIGPFCMVGPDVELHDDVELVSHITISGCTTIGARTKIYPFASIGHPPQDLKYKGESSLVIIGSDNVIREYVTIQPGTLGGLMKTTVGNNGLFMVGVHIAHDCVVGDHVIMANYATLAGHVTIDDYVIIGGLSAVQQHVHIGEHAMIGGMSGVERHVIPYGLVMGERASLRGLNLIGLKRRGFQNITKLRSLYTDVFEKEGLLSDRIQTVSSLYKDDETAQTLISFILSHDKLCLPS